MTRQLSFLAADIGPPSIDDVDGLLAGPAHTVRRGSAARLSLIVLERWRADVLVTELDRLEVGATVTAGEQGAWVVRTAFMPELAVVAERWSTGSAKRPPPRWVLTGARLRWWCLGAGHSDPPGYALGLGAGDEQAWPAIGSALAAAALPAVLVGARGRDPAYRVVGQRRLHRLAELVGDPPDGVPEESWPLSAAETVGGRRSM